MQEGGFWGKISSGFSKIGSGIVDFGKSIWSDERVSEWATTSWKVNMASSQAEKFIGLAVVSYIAIKVFK